MSPLGRSPVLPPKPSKGEEASASAPGLATAAAPHALAGVLLMITVTALFAGMDTLIRLAGATLPVVLMLAVRYAFQAVLMAALIVRHPQARLASAHPRFQLLRGALLLGCSAFNFVGLKYVPVAEFTSIALLSPVLVVTLAAWIYKERVTPLRWALVVGAWVGALVVMRPGSGVLGWAVLYPLGAVLFYSAFQLVSSRLAHAEHPYTTQWWTGWVGLALLVPLLLANAGSVGPALAGAGWRAWALMLAISALGTFGHLLFLQAFRLAPASTIAPLTYVQMGWAALFGWLLFAQRPDTWGWVGMAIVGVCGAASAWLNVRRQAGGRPGTLPPQNAEP